MTDTTVDTDSDAFADTVEYIEDAAGRRVKLPRRSARMEITVSKLVIKHVKTMQESDWPKINWKKITPADQIAIVSYILDVAPDLFADVCGIILDRDPDTVLDDFSLESLMEVVTPFLSGPVRAIQKITSSGLLRPAQQ